MPPALRHDGQRYAAGLKARFEGYGEHMSKTYKERGVEVGGHLGLAGSCLLLPRCFPRLCRLPPFRI